MSSARLAAAQGVSSVLRLCTAELLEDIPTCYRSPSVRTIQSNQSQKHSARSSSRIKRRKMESSLRDTRDLETLEKILNKYKFRRKITRTEIKTNKTRELRNTVVQGEALHCPPSECTIISLKLPPMQSYLDLTLETGIFRLSGLQAVTHNLLNGEHE